MPPVVHEMAAKYHLGGFQKTYRTNLLKTVVRTGIVLPSGLFCLWAGWYGSAPFHGPFAGTYQVLALRVAGAVLGAALLVQAAFALATVLRAAGRRVHLFQKGLVVARGRELEALPWGRIDAFWQDVVRYYASGISVGSRHVYRLRRGDGFEVRLDGLTGAIGELGEALSKGIVYEQLPKVLDAIHAGETLTFGPVAVNLQTIRHGRATLRWDEVQRFMVVRGLILIRRHGRAKAWARLRYARTPNAAVLLVVLEEMLRRGKQLRQPAARGGACLLHQHP